MHANVEKAKRIIRALEIILRLPESFTDQMSWSVEYYGIRVYVFPEYNDGEIIPDSSTKPMAELAKTLRREISGITQKGSNDYEFWLDVMTRDREIRFRIATPRKAACKKVVTGTKMVEEIDYEAAPKKMVEKETYVWECSPILSAEDGAE